ncbi:phospholipase D-like domain-containing protein [Jeotgalibacillus aurantiacus]|uniref:phospholipase D-like domain-containing protein n=1 Tax=Jeotgalibacillus aurantiacus TaxID=2763266 RepID=UPI001D0B3D2D|nr:phospholipase D-like domain-containing protein [Jeotgalibacillus aurantiacus]
MKVLIWIAAICLWLRLDWLIGLKRDRQTKCGTHYPCRQGEAAFFDDGVVWMKQLEEDCALASASIDMMFYIFQPDDAGKRMLELLVNKAREGVKVRLLLDSVGSRPLRKAIKQFNTKGISIKFSRSALFKGSWFDVQKRNHKKLTVIDGKVAHVGGFNIGREYLHLHPVLSPWRDYHLRLTGNIVQDCGQEFERDWSLKEVQTDGKNEDGYQIVSSSAVDQETFICGLLSKAKSSIFIGSPYFIPTSTVFDCLMDRVKRGVRLTILVPGTPDHPLVQPASYRYLRALLQMGADIYQLQHGFYHAKVLLIDDELCDIGTMNFDRRSLLINEELNVITRDRSVIEPMKESVAEDLMQSVQLTEDDLKVKPLKESAAWCIGHLL